MAVLLAATLASAQSEKGIIPVTTWPNVVYMDGKQFVNASVAICVEAGYRLLPAKPATPTGQRIKTEAIIQDDKDATRCKYEITYEDIPSPPTPPPVVPEVLTNVAAARVQYQFTTNGQYRATIWLDAPKTNVVTVK